MGNTIRRYLVSSRYVTIVQWVVPIVQALKIESQQDTNEVEVGFTMHHLGMVYEELEQYEKAIDMFTKSIELKEKVSHILS